MSRDGTNMRDTTDIDNTRENEINRELDACGMAYIIEDRDGNRFVYAGMESGMPVYRTKGCKTHILDLIGCKIIKRHV